MNVTLVYVTAPDSETAHSIATSLLEEKLIACANILPGVRSVYRWQGEVRDDAEVVVIAKTSARNVDTLIARVKSLHPYECPCVVTLPLKNGNPEFLEWIDKECR